MKSKKILKIIMKRFTKVLLLIIFVFQISQQANCEKVNIVNLNTWNITNENGSKCRVTKVWC